MIHVGGWQDFSLGTNSKFAVQTLMSSLKNDDALITAGNCHLCY